MDFESSDQDLLEDEPELEDGESADDTKDSVVIFHYYSQVQLVT